MKCPLKFRLTDYGAEVERIYTGDCLKEECAWWVETQDRCAIKDIALSLGYLSLDVTQLLEKMPHAGQLLK